MNKVKELLKTLSEKLLKNKKLTLILFAGLFGMLLVSLGSFGSESEKPRSAEVDSVSRPEFDENAEKELCEFLENISGAGNVKVKINYESGSESVYASDIQQSSSKTESSKEEIKSSNEHIILKANGNESGLEIKEIYPKVRGIAVICDGGNDPVIKEQITTLLCALYNIKSTQVSVAPMAA